MAKTFIISVSDPKFATPALRDQLKRNSAGQLSPTTWIIEVERPAESVLEAIQGDAGSEAGIAIVQVQNRGDHVGRHVSDRASRIMSNASIR